MKKRTNTRWLTQMALLAAILLVLCYTPLGYLQVGPLSMSFLTIPVAIGGMTLGPVGGTVLGAIFGLTSFMDAMAGKSAMGAALFSISPIATFVVCVGARVLMGLCSALIFAAAQKLLPKREKTTCLIGAVATPICNTVFFMGLLVLLFYGSDYVQTLVTSLGAANPIMFIVLLVGVQAVVEWVACGIVAAAVAVPLRRFLKNQK